MYQIDAVRLGPRCLDEIGDVRFGSKADIEACLRDVRFTPNSGHYFSASGCPLCAKSGLKHRRKATAHSIISSASNWIELGTSIPRALAVCALMRNSNLVDCRTGRSAGFAPFRI